ncbi:uncharacterized protein EV420DRAFT_1752685 [Desarmillaria tabescens]|uniref:Uncharacterized protein n=1 Tax=Armillaria tabescens TaxID=1929756 RepID=A0AA39JD68_ARMTA|nr:uncharacterized protein EV420DRAFT_1752685 [Desarmillaria tabescens]KAK0440453.1 hypothetical protein EV420DRAFT_1752685 [Desarmillaria tabescens]
MLVQFIMDQSDPQEFHFERRNSSQQFSQGDLIPFTPPDNITTEGTVAVNFPSPGEYTIDMIADNSRPITESLSIFASNPESGIGPSLTTTSVSSSSDVVSTQSYSISLESTLPSSTSSSSSGESMAQSTSQINESSLIAGRPSTTATTPASTSNNSYLHKPRNTSTIIGAVIGPILFLLLLSPFPQDPEHGVMHKLRGRDVPVPASVQVESGPEVPILSSINSGMAELGIEDEESMDHVPGKGRRRVSISVSPRDHSPAPSLSGGLAEPDSHQIPNEEPILHPSTSALRPHAMNDETAGEILRLQGQIQQLIMGSVSVWAPDSDRDPPPAYVSEVSEDELREM